VTTAISIFTLASGAAAPLGAVVVSRIFLSHSSANKAEALVRLAVAHAVASSTQAVDLIYDAAGAPALFENNPIERCFRDVHATTQHISTTSMNYDAAGRVLLGLSWGPGSL